MYKKSIERDVFKDMEKRDVRLQIVITETLKRKMVDYLFENRERSINDLVFKAISEYIDEQ